VEKGRKVKFQGNFTTLALWIPFHCHNLQLMGQAAFYASANKTTRIGDPTMPQSAVEVGDPYYHYLNYNKKFRHHNRWVEFLWNQTLMHKATNERDVTIFGGGLHQLALDNIQCRRLSIRRSPNTNDLSTGCCFTDETVSHWSPSYSTAHVLESGQYGTKNFPRGLIALMVAFRSSVETLI